MQIIDNLVIRNQMLAELRAKYMGGEGRPKGIHMTDCIYCLERSYYDLVDPNRIQHTDKELMLFAVGFGMEKMLLRPEQVHEPVELDGIWVSPDFVTLEAGKAELKTTRQKTTMTLPETWLEQMMGYSWVLQVKEYDLVVFYIIPPEMKGYHIVWEGQELKDNWENILLRKQVLVEKITGKRVLEPGQWCRAWECKNCRYKVRCGR